MAQSKAIEKSIGRGRHITITLLYMYSEGWEMHNMKKINEWSGSIVNHFWFCCCTCEGKLMKLKVFLQNIWPVLSK